MPKKWKNKCEIPMTDSSEVKIVILRKSQGLITLTKCYQKYLKYLLWFSQ